MAAGQRDPGAAMPRGYAGAAIAAHLDTFPAPRGLVAGSYGEVSPALRAFVRECGALVGEREWRGMGARSAAEYGGVATGEMMRRLSVMIHASHMHVLYARWRFAGMSAAQAARGGDAGGAQGIR